MSVFLLVVQAFLAIFLIIAILLQQRGTTLGGAFGAEGNIYRTRRGAERILFGATIVLAVSFLLTSILVVLFR